MHEPFFEAAPRNSGRVADRGATPKAAHLRRRAKGAAVGGRGVQGWWFQGRLAHTFLRGPQLSLCSSSASQRHHTQHAAHTRAARSTHAAHSTRRSTKRARDCKRLIRDKRTRLRASARVEFVLGTAAYNECVWRCSSTTEPRRRHHLRRCGSLVAAPDRATLPHDPYCTRLMDDARALHYCTSPGRAPVKNFRRSAQGTARSSQAITPVSWTGRDGRGRAV